LETLVAAPEPVLSNKFVLVAAIDKNPVVVSFVGANTGSLLVITNAGSVAGLGRIPADLDVNFVSIDPREVFPVI
jgi:hypothetical protein